MQKPNTNCFRRRVLPIITLVKPTNRWLLRTLPTLGGQDREPGWYEREMVTSKSSYQLRTHSTHRCTNSTKSTCDMQSISRTTAPAHGTRAAGQCIECNLQATADSRGRTPGGDSVRSSAQLAAGAVGAALQSRGAADALAGRTHTRAADALAAARHTRRERDHHGRRCDSLRSVTEAVHIRLTQSCCRRVARLLTDTCLLVQRRRFARACAWPGWARTWRRLGRNAPGHCEPSPQPTFSRSGCSMFGGSTTGTETPTTRARLPPHPTRLSLPRPPSSLRLRLRQLRPRSNDRLAWTLPRMSRRGGNFAPMHGTQASRFL